MQQVGILTIFQSFLGIGKNCCLGFVGIVSIVHYKDDERDSCTVRFVYRGSC